MSVSIRFSDLLAWPHTAVLAFFMVHTMAIYNLLLVISVPKSLIVFHYLEYEGST